MPAYLVKKDVAPSVAEANEAINFHGVNGIWGDDCGLERGILSMYVKPKGILRRLPAIPTEVDLIRVGAITGFKPNVDQDPPDKPCDTGRSGKYSTCRLDFELGSIKYSGDTIDWVEQQRRLNRSDENFALMGSLYGQGSLGAFGSGIWGNTPSDVLNRASELQIQTIAQNIALDLGRMVWTGDPSAPAPENMPGGATKSFKGFDLLVKTGYVDAGNTENECPTMDSQVYDFLWGDVCSGTVTINSVEMNLIQLLANACWRNEMLASDSNFNDFAGVLVMPEALFHQITDCYVCLYNTNFCATNTNFINDYAVRERDAMRNGMYIVLNGKTYIVEVDNGMPIQDATSDPDHHTGSERSADIYFIPLTLNGMAVTYLRYQDLRRGAQEFADAGQFGQRPPFRWTDDGKYVLTSQWVETCYLHSARILPGLVMLTPQLAFRINNVLWSDAIPLRSPYPDSPDFVIDTPLYPV